MVDDDDSEASLLDASAQAARREFLGWQCRIRQLSVRQAGGRPTSGMHPAVMLPESDEKLTHVVVLIRRKASPQDTSQFQHMVRKTRDPAERYDSALRFLAAAYYQRPDEFSDGLTALFGPLSTVADRLVEAGACRLVFEQYEQRFCLTCRVSELAPADAAFQFTYWHNSLFNAAIPGDARVLEFRPCWTGGAL